MGAHHRFPRGTTESNLPQKSHPRPQTDDITANLGCKPSACVEGRPLCWNSASSLCALDIQPGAACCLACWEPPCGHRGAPPHQHSPSASIFAALLKKSRSRKVSNKNNRAVSSSHKHTNTFIPLTFVTPPAHRRAAAVQDNDKYQ